ncbi:MAG: hypothetical protein LBS19_02270 [Clostridiales bacterium]|nr:hypothetical protein [Clostridiales bacterium]
MLASLVHKLETVQDLRFERSRDVYSVKLVEVNGTRAKRNIRLYKKGLPVLDGLYPGLLDHYLTAFKGHDLSNDQFHIRRNHMVAEVLALCMSADIEMRPYILPKLQKDCISVTVPETPSFYIARYIKKISPEELNKTAFTRVVGAIFWPGGVYAAYNTRNAAMKWSGHGEIKTLAGLQELERMNAGSNMTPSALLFGYSADVALKTVLESDKNRRLELRFDHVYRNIHYIPLNKEGVRFLKILVSPDWNEKLLGALFEERQRSYNRGTMEYDAIVDGRIILSHLDGNIARLVRFREAMQFQTKPADVLCFPFQTEFLKAYLGGLAGLRELSMESVESAILGGG